MKKTVDNFFYCGIILLIMNYIQQTTSEIRRSNSNLDLRLFVNIQAM